MPDWPDWWQYELDVSGRHLGGRMRRRSFNEVELRDMMEHATGFQPSHEAGRWLIETSFEGADWRVVVEPEESRKRLFVVTAFEVY